eukprot:1211624-Amphidinium_carterae.1
MVVSCFAPFFQTCTVQRTLLQCQFVLSVNENSVNSECLVAARAACYKYDGVPSENSSGTTTVIGRQPYFLRMS